MAEVRISHGQRRFLRFSLQAPRLTGCRHVRVRPIIAGRIKQWRFVFESAGYRFDAESGRVLCFCCDPERFLKYVGPMRKGE